SSKRPSLCRAGIPEKNPSAGTPFQHAVDARDHRLERSHRHAVVDPDTEHAFAVREAQLHIGRDAGIGAGADDVLAVVNKLEVAPAFLGYRTDESVERAVAATGDGPRLAVGGDAGPHRLLAAIPTAFDAVGDEAILAAVQIFGFEGLADAIGRPPHS